ncbi:MAG: hypothetical protein RIT26_1823 [Pseudomonadota bacterium]|jgi:diacylglycerol kinase (ATP)
MPRGDFEHSLIYRRLVKAAGHSWAGLQFAWRSEEAFRVEVILCLFLAPLAFVLEPSTSGRLWLLSALWWVLMVELLNTAVEKAIDRISSESHELSKASKDLGSAAVLMSILGAVGVWVSVLA